MFPSRRSAIGLVGVAAAMVAWALLAPRERQLGDGIRLVYLHVALTWAGLVGIYLAGTLGLVQAFRSRTPVQAWIRTSGVTGIALFAAGFALSLASAHVSWGGILWAEPRVPASLGVIALGAVVAWTDRWAMGIRWKGLLWVVLAGVTGWSLQTARLFFHPQRPIQEATSTLIKGTFYGMFVLALAAGVLAGALIHPSSRRMATGRHDATRPPGGTRTE